MFEKLFQRSQKKSTRVVGITFHDETARWVVLDRDEATYRVTHHGQIALPVDLFSSRDTEPYETCATLLAGLRRFNDVPLVCALPFEGVYQEHFAIPSLVGDRADIERFLEGVVARHADLVLGDTVCSYETLETRDGITFVYATMYSASLIAPIKHLATLLGFRDVVFRTIPDALNRLHDDEEHVRALIHVGTHNSHLFLMRGDEVLAQRRVSYGVMTLRAAVQEYLGEAGDDALVTKIIDRYGLLTTHRDPALYTLLVQKTHVLVDELYGLLDEYTVRADTPRHYLKTSHELFDVVVVGQGSGISGLLDFLGKVIHTHVHPLHTWRLFPDIEQELPCIDARDTLRFADAIAIAMREMR